MAEFFKSTELKKKVIVMMNVHKGQLAAIQVCVFFLLFLGKQEHKPLREEKENQKTKTKNYNKTKNQKI